jgi:argininosuccinate synthase
MTQRVVLAYPGGLDTSVATFDQSMATGFVELWGLPSKIAALRDTAG